MTATTAQPEYTETREDGSFYKLDEAAEGWLISEQVHGSDLRTGRITKVRGGGYTYRDQLGGEWFVPMRKIYAVACPVTAR